MTLPTVNDTICTQWTENIFQFTNCLSPVSDRFIPWCITTLFQRRIGCVIHLPSRTELNWIYTGRPPDYLWRVLKRKYTLSQSEANILGQWQYFLERTLSGKLSRVVGSVRISELIIPHNNSIIWIEVIEMSRINGFWKVIHSYRMAAGKTRPLDDRQSNWRVLEF